MAGIKGAVEEVQMESTAQIYSFNVEGMHCYKCIEKIKTLGSDQRISHVDVDMSKNSVKFYAKESIDQTELLKKITSLGYKAKLLLGSVAEDAVADAQQKLFLKRIAVAGTCTGNIMLLSFANYFGAALTSYGIYFEWIMFVLFLPVLFFSATPILQSSFSALKARRTSIDLPLAIALIFGFILSTRNLLLGKHQTYFDSLAMFVFLLLSTRYFLFKLQSKYLNPIDVTAMYSTDQVQRIKNGVVELIMPGQVHLGDMIQIKRGFRPSFDGELASDGAEFDNSLITGEVNPVYLKRTEKIYSGTKLVSETATILVQKVGADCRASQIIAKTNATLQQKTPLISLTDTIAQRFSLVVVLVSALTFFLLKLDADDLFNRILALLVLACPCALAVATPLAISLTARKALDFNILVKKSDLFERITKIKNIVFDKTGTLTKGEFAVVKVEPSAPTEAHKNIILSLEQKSEHPIALALREHLNFEFSNLDLVDYKEIPGVGVEAFVQGIKYELKSDKTNAQNTQVGFFENGKLVYSFQLADVIHKSSSYLTRWLSNKNYNVFVLSGDNSASVNKLGRELELSNAKLFSDLTPELKAEKIEEISSRGETLFLGDGANDCLAMAKSNASLSTNKSVDVSFKTSDAHILKEGLSSVVDLFNLSDKLMKTIKVNLLISILYNSFFAFLALSGKVNPYLAALLMPISSFTLISHTFLSLHFYKSEFKS